MSASSVPLTTDPDRWVQAHVSTGINFTAAKANGAAPLLDHEQCEIAAGWVLWAGKRAQVDYDRLYTYRAFAGLDARGLDPKRVSRELRHSFDERA